MSDASAEDGKVVRLMSVAPGFSPDDATDLCDWAVEWIEGIKAGEYGSPKSIAIVVEREDGRLGVVSQSLGVMDRARIVGLLHLAAQWKADGNAQIEDLKP